MTLIQVYSFLEILTHREKLNLSLHSSTIRTAVWADKEQYKKFIKNIG